MKDLTDLDYRDLFLDAVNMMAHIARAAGFDPADPTVEPPAVVARVENLRADLATARRLLPPRYVAADGSILDPERCTPHAPDCAECGRGRAHDEGCLALLATPAEEVVGLRAEVQRLTAELEEARLTLAAEQGRVEGGPPGWVYEPGDEDFDEPGEWVNADRSLTVWRSGTGWVWGCRIANGAYQGPRQQPEGQTARAAMLAASAAHSSTPAPAPTATTVARPSSRCHDCRREAALIEGLDICEDCFDAIPDFG